MWLKGYKRCCNFLSPRHPEFARSTYPQPALQPSLMPYLSTRRSQQWAMRLNSFYNSLTNQYVIHQQETGASSLRNISTRPRQRTSLPNRTAHKITRRLNAAYADHFKAMEREGKRARDVLYGLPVRWPEILYVFYWNYWAIEQK